MKIVFQSVSKKGREIAKAVASRAKDEILEYPKHISSQIRKTETHPTGGTISPIAEAMQQGTRKVSESEHEDIHKGEKKQLDYLTRELEALKRKRQVENDRARMAEIQSPQTQAQENQQKLPEILVSSKKSRRLLAFGQQRKSKGAGEMLKSQK